MSAPYVVELLLIKGVGIPMSGIATNDPDELTDPIAIASKTQVVIAVVDN
jgi:hypothetical protein